MSWSILYVCIFIGQTHINCKKDVVYIICKSELGID